MKLTTDGTLEARSAPPYFTLERDGRKPNTIRLVDEVEFDLCTRAKAIRIHGLGANSGDLFIRSLSGVFDVTDGMVAGGFDIPRGCHAVMLCWEAS